MRETVILVHGLGFSRAQWAPHVAALEAGGYRAVAYDLRGFGEAPLPEEPYSMADLAEDLEQVRVAAGVEAAHFVGHSLGGMVVQQYAVTYPRRVRSLGVASATSHNGRRASAFAEARAAHNSNEARALGWRATIGFSVKDQLAGLMCPCLVMHGVDDPLIPSIVGALIARAIPDAQWQPFKGGRHNFPIDEPDAFAEAVLQFLG